jgi:hypothetical protein
MRTVIFLATFLFFSSLNMFAEVNSNVSNHHCLACEVPNGLVVNDLTGTSATLSWNAVAGATQYTIEVQDEQVNPSVFHLETNVAGNTFALTGLQSGVLYKFKVRARCGGDKSDWSDWFFFTSGTGGGGGSNTCEIPSGLTVGVVGGVATMGWTAVNGAVKYSIEVEDEQNTPSIFHLEDFSLTNSYTLAGLQTGVLYKFKVRTHCVNGQSDWSAWMFFNGVSGGGNGSGNGTCGIPTGIQTSNITTSEVLLSWDAVPGVATYTLEIERNKKNVGPWQITQVVTNNSFVLTGLDENTRYKFKVRSNCTGGGHSNWSKWRKFQTAHNFTNDPGNANLQDGAGNRDASSPEINLAFEVEIWPNPVQSNATVRLQNLDTESVALRLFDFAGRLVEEKHIHSEGGTWEGAFGTDQLSNGMYLLQAQTGAKTKTLKLVVNH